MSGQKEVWIDRSESTVSVSASRSLKLDPTRVGQDLVPTQDKVSVGASRRASRLIGSAGEFANMNIYVIKGGKEKSIGYHSQSLRSSLH